MCLIRVQAAAGFDTAFFLGVHESKAKCGEVQKAEALLGEGQQQQWGTSRCRPIPERISEPHSSVPGDDRPIDHDDRSSHFVDCLHCARTGFLKGQTPVAESLRQDAGFCARRRKEGQELAEEEEGWRQCARFQTLQPCVDSAPRSELRRH